MSEDQQRFLALLRQPQARFTVEQTAWALNFQPYEILVLVTLRLLRPLGSPPAPNAMKYFPALKILDLAKDEAWLLKATNALYNHRFKKNRLQKARRMNPSQTELFSPPESNGASGVKQKPRLGPAKGAA